MGTTPRIVRGIEQLIVQADTEDPPALDKKDREALRVVLRIAAESESAFQKILRKRTIVRTERTDYSSRQHPRGHRFLRHGKTECWHSSRCRRARDAAWFSANIVRTWALVPRTETSLWRSDHAAVNSVEAYSD